MSGLIYSQLATAEQMRALDRRATEDYGIPSLTLMENAGRAVADAAKDMLGDVTCQRVLVVCGTGNNGGDGFVAARHLSNAGAAVRIAYYGDRAKAKGDALANLQIAEKMRLQIETDCDEARLAELARDSKLVIDAMLGTGTKGQIREPFLTAIRILNIVTTFGGKVLAVDVPTGIDSDTGQTLGPAVMADATVTFQLAKIGLFIYPGAWHAGRVIAADIGIPCEAVSAAKISVGVLNSFCAVRLATKRPPDSHKGKYGHVAIVAGSVGMTGAAALAAEGALRIGTGLVTCLVPESLNDIMEVKLTEAMTIPVPQGNARAFGMASLDKVLEYANKWGAAVIGPGFGRDEDTIAFTLKLIAKLKKPAIIDADALYAVSKDLSVLKKCKAQLVITPHPGEMATLLGTTTEEVQSNRLETARSFAKEHRVTVVLKGAGTVVAVPDGHAFINTTGSPGMATGGTGDVLSGMIGGLLARWHDPDAAAKAAVYLHGRAGEIAAEKLGEASMIASDVADSIGAAIQEVCNLLQRSDPPLAHER